MPNPVEPGMKFRRLTSGRVYVARDQDTGSVNRRAWRTECGSVCDLANAEKYEPVSVDGKVR